MIRLMKNLYSFLLQRKFDTSYLLDYSFFRYSAISKNSLIKNNPNIMYLVPHADDDLFGGFALAKKYCRFKAFVFGE